MKNDIFYSDMALDNLENRGIGDIATTKNLSYGIRQIVVNVKDNNLSQRVGKPKGLYVTYDCSDAKDDRYADYLAKILANTIRQAVGILPMKSTCDRIAERLEGYQWQVLFKRSMNTFLLTMAN